MTDTHFVDPNLKNYADTQRQKDMVDAANECGSYAAAAAKLGVHKDGVRKGIVALTKRAEVRGYSPENSFTRPVPSMFQAAGISTYYKATETEPAQWVKAKLDNKQTEAAIREFIEWLSEDVRGLSPIVPSPLYTTDDLLAVYPMGDPHFGMYAWAEEAGDNFDLDEAERITKAAFDRLVSSAPPAKTGLILELGDFFHADNESNKTARSGNSLDVDTRWARVMQVGLRTMIYCVLRTLEKHEKVIVRIVRGNHDTHSSFALALALDAFFANNDRVQIELSPSAFWYFEWGNVLIGCTHGDTCKPGDLAGVMASDRAKEWGRTLYRYWYHGHIHHSSKKEFPGVLVESFRTLAAKDAWHANEGYRSGRDMNLIVHHKLYGEVERHRCDIGLINS